MSCNRCGKCCEEFTLPYSPDEVWREVARHLGSWLKSEENLFFLQGAVPVRRLHAGPPGYKGLVPSLRPVEWWLYRCLHFRRDDDGKGVCTIYDHRTYVCLNYAAAYLGGDLYHPREQQFPLHQSCAFYRPVQSRLFYPQQVTQGYLEFVERKPPYREPEFLKEARKLMAVA